ncbi:MAG: hypothetical protein MUP19_00265 [Candidatus Aminicenantes bacterium]|nr:hypothetical protein [Candidatus Aminicenantes bacterium]
MKRQFFWVLAALALVLIAGRASAYAQGTFKVPFKFESGNQKFPSGEYWVALTGDGKITFRLVSSGKEVQVPFLEKLNPPTPPIEGPQLVFDAVGNFEPSYTEYFTVYILAEVWLPGDGGFLIHTTKGAHQTQTVKGEAAKK